MVKVDKSTLAYSTLNSENWGTPKNLTVITHFKGKLYCNGATSRDSEIRVYDIATNTYTTKSISPWSIYSSFIESNDYLYFYSEKSCIRWNPENNELLEIPSLQLDSTSYAFYIRPCQVLDKANNISYMLGGYLQSIVKFEDVNYLQFPQKILAPSIKNATYNINKKAKNGINEYAPNTNFVSNGDIIVILDESTSVNGTINIPSGTA